MIYCIFIEVRFMFIYLFIIGIPLLLFILRGIQLHRFQKYIIVILFNVILFVFYVFRSIFVGSDYKTYYSWFQLLTPYQLQNRFVEPGYIFLNRLAQNCNNFLIISLVIYFVCALGLFLLCRQLNLDIFLALAFFILTYFYFFMFNGIRQFLALGILCIGLYCIFKFNGHIFVKYLLFFLIVMIARLFHNTSIFGIVFLLLPKLHYGRKTVIISGVLTIFLYWTNIVRKFFNSLLFLFPSYFMKYGEYNDGGILTSQSIGDSWVPVIPIVVQFIFLYIFVSFNNKYRKNTEFNFIISGYLLYLVMFSAAGNTIAVRLQTYTYIFPILYSCLFINSNWKCEKLKLRNRVNISCLYKILYVIFMMFLYIFYLYENNSGIIPYSFI